MTWRNAILIGDVREKLRELPDESVHCVVTSPPYWGLRDYGTASWEGGDAGCDHKQSGDHLLNAGFNERWGNATGAKKQEEEGRRPYRETCGKCGARRIDNQLGLEATPEAFVCNLVAVFREVRRVLRADGTVWLNLGDSYNAGTSARRKPSPNPTDVGYWQEAGEMGDLRRDVPGLKPKDLVGQPWRVAFALQADGWWLRSDIIWSKPNPMPESVTDRPTKAHEYLFLLSKSATYYYDQDAIREPLAPGELDRRRPPRAETSMAWGKGVYHSTAAMPSHSEPMLSNPSGRNRRTVWEIPTEPYAEAHFATYPQALVKPCIQAGCPEGGVVLDPFLGSGTTALVALKAGRDFVGIELNPEYAAMAEKRIAPFRRRLL